MVRRIWRILAATLLIALGVGGFQGLWNNLGTADTVFQYSVFGGQVLLGLAGIVAGLGGLLGKPWAGAAALFFAAGMAYAAGAGPVAWGEVAWPRGLADAGIGFLIGFILFLGVRARDQGSAEAATRSEVSVPPPS